MKQPRFALLALSLLLSGCLIGSSTDGVALVQPDDIPVPKGMNLLEHLNESHTLVNGIYRFENLVYEGKTSPIDVSAFLRERMRQHSHRLISESKKNDDLEVLVFQRGRYTSECTVRRLPYSTRLEVRVRTDLKLP